LATGILGLAGTAPEKVTVPLIDPAAWLSGADTPSQASVAIPHAPITIHLFTLPMSSSPP
jgi:hypothetical protein